MIGFYFILVQINYNKLNVFKKEKSIKQVDNPRALIGVQTIFYFLKIRSLIKG
jgi:hypothetical protein